MLYKTAHALHEDIHYSCEVEVLCFIWKNMIEVYIIII